jgi:hypothetical protein
MLVAQYIEQLLKQANLTKVCGLEQWANEELLSVSNKLNELNQPYAELSTSSGAKLKLLLSPALGMVSIWAISQTTQTLQEAGVTREQILAIRQLIAQQLGNKHVPSMKRVANWLLDSGTSIEQTVAGHIAYWTEAESNTATELGYTEQEQTDDATQA